MKLLNQMADKISTQYVNIDFLWNGTFFLFQQKVQIAQQAEQRTENPCDGSSNLSLNIEHENEKN